VPVGQVIRAHSNIYYVLVDGREVECRPRGRFRLDKQGVLVGDTVTVHLEGENDGRIDKVEPRKTVLQRPAVANVDQALVMFTMKQPDVDFLFLDRVLIHVEQAGIEAVLLLNKVDLLTEEEIESFKLRYAEQAGYRVLTMAAKQGMGVEAVRPLLVGRVSVLAGHSGVGKSRLIRALEPDRVDVKVGDLSEKLGRGKHTTRHVELIQITGGGLVADTPGFTYLEFADIDKWTLWKYFREFRGYRGECRFDDCMHNKEPDCAVREAVERGEVSRGRYDHYLMFLKEIEALKRW
jgi:ribosome biogenesis GTPase / thiamine phosphate phosphatase